MMHLIQLILFLKLNYLYLCQACPYLNNQGPTLNGLPWAWDGPIAQLGFSNSPSHWASPWRLLVWFLGIKPTIKWFLQTCLGAMVSGKYFRKWKVLILFILSWNPWSQLLAGFKSWHTFRAFWWLLKSTRPKQKMFQQTFKKSQITCKFRACLLHVSNNLMTLPGHNTWWGRL